MHGLKLTAAHTTACPPDVLHFAGRTETHEPTQPRCGAHRRDGTLAAHVDVILVTPQVSLTANRIGQERRTGCGGNGMAVVATLLQFFLIRGFQ